MQTTSALYWHRHYRFLSMLRGTLITAVYGKATSIVAMAKDNKASITLMSTDVERSTRGLIDLHEMWANIVQVAIATWLLEIELGAACVGPVIVAIGKHPICRSIRSHCTDCYLAAVGTTIWFSGYTASFQLLWIDKVQARIGTILREASNKTSVRWVVLTFARDHHLDPRLDESHQALWFDFEGRKSFASFSYPRTRRRQAVSYTFRHLSRYRYVTILGSRCSHHYDGTCLTDYPHRKRAPAYSPCPDFCDLCRCLLQGSHCDRYDQAIHITGSHSSCF